MTDATKSVRAAARTPDHSIRGWNDVLGLWRLCRNARCMRADACRGACAQRCFTAHVPLLPDTVMAWLYELADAQQQGLTYDQALERMTGTDAQGALEDWHGAIAYSRTAMQNRRRAE
jgi:hypothetical protein